MILLINFKCLSKNAVNELGLYISGIKTFETKNKNPTLDILFNFKIYRTHKIVFFFVHECMRASAEFQYNLIDPVKFYLGQLLLYWKIFEYDIYFDFKNDV